MAEVADGPALRDLFPPGEPVSDQLPGAEDAPGFRCSDDQVVVAPEGAACVDSEARGANWDCEAAPGFAPLDHDEALGVSMAGRRGAVAGAEAPLPKPDGYTALLDTTGEC